MREAVDCLFHLIGICEGLRRGNGQQVLREALSELSPVGVSVVPGGFRGGFWD